MSAKLAIHGAAGRMGKRLIALGNEDPGLSIVAAVEGEGCDQLGTDAGLAAGIQEIGVPLASAWPEDVDTAIDFSVPAACLGALEHCKKAGIPFVLATTGLSDADQEKIHAASKEIPICWAPNMSLAVNLTMKLAEKTASALKDVPQGADVEILERHHRFKEDSPSGTALKFGEIVADAMGLTNHVHGREGLCGARGRDEVGYHAIRTGDDPGQHTIVFGMLGETIELRVAASNRDCYAQGALVASKFLIGKEPGIYNMFDVLGLN
ncbi:MAG: 4-hydroxy-tetrahydrodipicolinate reductase [Planctomycetota bacterium]